MNRTREIAVLKVLLSVLICAASSATATTRGGFFDVSKRPTIHFDSKTLTWTLRNQALERVVHFDSKAGALKTTAFRDIRHNWSLPVEGTFEGSLAFTPPVIGNPTPLSVWKTVIAPPPANWAKTDFDDSSWSTYEPGGDAKVRWFRGRIATGLMSDVHSWALLFDRALHGDTEIYYDGVLAQKVTLADRPTDRLLEIDLPAQTHVIAIKISDPDAPADFNGSVSVSQIGSCPPNVELNQDWKYMLHSINTNESGSMILSISLSGVQRYEGFDIDVYYQIYPGDEPYIVKWFTFSTHRSTKFTLEEVIFDRFPLPSSNSSVMNFPGSAHAASDSQTGNGLFGGVVALTGRSERSVDGKHIAVLDRPEYGLRPNTPQDTARSVIGLYRGSPSSGAFLFQLYIGQYISRATPISVPNCYNTWYGYREKISAVTCENIIPIAEKLGVKLFVVDHGWETNAAPDTGTLGDWLTDKSPLKFPNGLLPISLMVREHKMRFGLWTAPTAVNEKSQAAVNHASWLLREPGNLPVSAFDFTDRMCFTSGWADNYTVSIRDLCRELGATYVKVDGKLFHDFCCDPAHDHPVGRAISVQSEYWNKFAEEMRKLDPEFVINRSTESGPEVTSVQDEGICTDWEITADQKRSDDPTWWYKNADLCRRALHDLLWTRPAFTLECESPCHIPAESGGLDALEYHLTTAAAYVSNMEIHGRLEEMKPEEQALVQKWVRWNDENRPWLAYSQPLSSLGKPWNAADRTAQPHIDGMLHLRTPLLGRYGYLCLWNPSGQSASTPISFRPADCQIKTAGGLEVVRLKDGKTVPFGSQNGVVMINNLQMAPHSWEIYEIRQTGKPRTP